MGIEACALIPASSDVNCEALGRCPCGACRRLTLSPTSKRQRTDAADAEAICEAVTRANIQFVATGSQPSNRGAHGAAVTARAICSSASRAAVINAIRSHLGEFGVESHLSDAMVSRTCSTSSPIQVTSGFLRIDRACLAALGWPSCASSKRRNLEFDRMIRAWHTIQ